MQLKGIFWRLILCVAVIMIMVTIYLLSDQPASQSRQLSNSFAVQTHQIYEAMTQTELTEREWNRKLRKIAHVSIYFALSIFVMLMCLAFKRKLIAAIGITVSLCLLYAISDELHQYFVVGRGASIVDVGFDSIGIILGVILISLIKWRISK